MTSPRSRSPYAQLLLFAGVIAPGGCSHEVDYFKAHDNTQSNGSIGSSNGDVGDDEGDDESGDDESSSGAQPGDGGSQPADADDEGGSAPASDDGGASEDDGVPAETGSGDPVLDGCLAIAANACETCACNLCLDPLYACEQDAGCVAMRDCAEQAGCEGPDCLEPCGAVIDMYGGPFGSSGALALELSDCLASTCPACF